MCAPLLRFSSGFFVGTSTGLAPAVDSADRARL